MSAASSSSTSLAKLLSLYSDLHVIGNNKVKCQLSGHEMNYTVEAIESYVNGAKFKRLQNLQALLNKFGQYFEDRGANKLYCKITRRTISKEGKEIERHVNGTRFQRALIKYGATNDNDDVRMELDNNDNSTYPSTNPKNNNNRVQYIEEEEKLSDEDDSVTSQSGEQSDLSDFYPELETSESCDSDFDFRAMDTDIDTSGGNKRKHKNSTDSNCNKKKRSL